MYIKNLFLLIFLITITFPISAGEKIVSAITLVDDPPYCFLKKDIKKKFEIIPPGKDSEKLQGYSWDVLRESFHEMGYTIKLTILPWARAMFTIKKAEADILFPTGLTKDRQEYLYYSQEELNRVYFLIYVKKDSKIKWVDLNSLNGLNIGAMRAWNYGEQWKFNNKIKKWNVNKISQGFSMLDKDRIDGFAGYELNFDHALKIIGKHGIYKKLPVFDTASEYLAGSKKRPNIKKILQDFDTGKRKIIKNGKFKKINIKWFGSE
jgi:polar amino acid transport system substrate-binding protein